MGRLRGLCGRSLRGSRVGYLAWGCVRERGGVGWRVCAQPAEADITSDAAARAEVGV